MLKIQSYIKQWKVNVLVDSGSAHYFIHRWVAKETHFYVNLMHAFQIMISNGGPMKCGGYIENVWLQMGGYQLKTYIFVIYMDGCDIMLGGKW